MWLLLNLKYGCFFLNKYILIIANQSMDGRRLTWNLIHFLCIYLFLYIRDTITSFDFMNHMSRPFIQTFTYTYTHACIQPFTLYAHTHTIFLTHAPRRSFSAKSRDSRFLSSVRFATSVQVAQYPYGRG